MEASSKQTRLRKNTIGSFHLKSLQKMTTCHLTLSHFAGLLGLKTIVFQFLERWDQWFPRYSPPKLAILTKMGITTNIQMTLSQ